MQNSTKVTNLEQPQPEAGEPLFDWGTAEESAPINPVEIEFSTAASSVGTGVGSTMTLQAWFEGIRAGRWRKVVEQVRAERDPVKQAEMKRQELFISFPSVVLNGGKRSDQVEKYTGVVVVDIDEKDNDKSDLEALPERLKADPFVLGFHLSCRGGGYAVFYLVNSSLTEHPEAYKQLSKHVLNVCHVTADKQANNVNRARYASHDPNAWLNPLASTFDVEARRPHLSQRLYRSFGEGEFTALIDAIIETRADITSEPFDWFRLGKWCAQTHGEDGRELFHQLSQFYPKYTARECDKRFTAWLAQYMRDGKKVSENIPRILAKKYAPEAWARAQRVGFEFVTNLRENSRITGEAGGFSVAGENVTKTHENNDKTTVNDPKTVGHELSTKDETRATQPPQGIRTLEPQPNAPQNARKGPKTAQQLVDMFKATAYNHDSQYMPPDPVLSIGGQRFATAGNLSVVVGLQKSGKGFLLSAIAAAYLRGECLGFKAKPIEGKPDVVIIDTEQDTGDLHTTTERLKRALTDEQFARVSVYSWCQELPQDGLEMLPLVTKLHPTAGLVIVDGIADLSPAGVNDDQGARHVAHTLKALAGSGGIHLVTVIHLNKSTAKQVTSGREFAEVANAEVAGHLGINLQRKAETVIGVYKNHDRHVHEVYSVNARGKAFEMFGFTVSRPIDMPEMVDPLQLKAIKASETQKPNKPRPVTIDTTTHHELVREVFKVAEWLSSANLSAHICRVVGDHIGTTISKSLAQSYATHWEAEQLIERKYKARDSRQQWRALIAIDRTGITDMTPEEFEAFEQSQGVSMFEPDPIETARIKAIQHKKRLGKKGGTRRIK